ncbi:hypothetical protein AB0M47_12980 [Hamadaea sp. NPDC051192]|uniref:hypothetical protein n=1 Tax=Hamadaea sp. NPDC051192 TaxID=3154940 RepID=UPI00341B08BE
MRRTRHYRLHLAGLRLTVAGILTCGAAAVLGELRHHLPAVALVFLGFAQILYGLLLATTSLLALRGAREDISIWRMARAAARDLLWLPGGLDRL